MKYSSVWLENLSLELPVKGEKNLLALLIKHKIDIDHSCGGMGSCGTCRVLVQSPLSCLPDRNPVEQERATDLAFSPKERLACQLCPADKLQIKIP